MLVASHFDQDPEQDSKTFEERLDTGARLRQWLDATDSCASPEPQPSIAERELASPLQMDYSNVQISALRGMIFKSLLNYLSSLNFSNCKAQSRIWGFCR